MARSLKKGPFVDHHLLKKVETAGGSKKPISSVENAVKHTRFMQQLIDAAR